MKEGIQNWKKVVRGVDMEKDKETLERLENLAHEFAFTRLGTFYWENFLIAEDYYNNKYNKYNRRW